MRKHVAVCDVCSQEEKLNYDERSYPYYFELPRDWYQVTVDFPTVVKVDADVCSRTCGSKILERALEVARA